MISIKQQTSFFNKYAKTLKKILVYFILILKKIFKFSYLSFLPNPMSKQNIPY